MFTRSLSSASDLCRNSQIVFKVIKVVNLHIDCRGNMGQSRDKSKCVKETQNIERPLIRATGQKVKKDVDRDLMPQPESKRIKNELSSTPSLIVQTGFLQIGEDELDLERTLLGGQSFRWRKQIQELENSEPDIYYTGPIGDVVYRLWRETAKTIGYKVYQQVCNIKGDNINPETVLSDYFRLNYDLSDLYRCWSERDDNFTRRAANYKGLRILRQDPVENVFSFICATNNNIKRISGMVENMCKRFGQHLLNLDSTEGQRANKPQGDDLKTGNDIYRHSTTYDLRMINENSYYSFPTIQRLASDDVYDCLRHELGFGYRAKFISQSAKLLLTLSENANFDDARNYLMSLRSMEYKQACTKLQKLPGIGRKVADCICLMSMDHLCSVPTDCHIYEIVCRDYMTNLKKDRKSLTDSVHDLIGSYFRELHGQLAGWSTSVLFVAELKHLQKGKDDTKVNARKKTSRKKIIQPYS